MGKGVAQLMSNPTVIRGGCDRSRVRGEKRPGNAVHSDELNAHISSPANALANWVRAYYDRLLWRKSSLLSLGLLMTGCRRSTLGDLFRVKRSPRLQRMLCKPFQTTAQLWNGSPTGSIAQVQICEVSNGHQITEGEARDENERVANPACAGAR